MQIGIIGLPSSGKSTIFQALTGSRAGGYGRREQANVAVVRVPDERIDTLVPMFNPKKTIYATVEFADLGGLKGRTEGQSEGFTPQFLAAARQVDALCAVLGAYLPGADPKADMEEIELELNFADLSVVQKRLERLGSDIKKAPTPSKTALEAEQQLLSRLAEALEAGTPIRDLDISAEEDKLLRGYGFLTAKPMLAIENVDESQLGSGEPSELGVPSIRIAGTIEAEIAELDPEDRELFMSELGITEPGTNRLIRLAYRSIGLISFFTVGPDEVRAWTIPEGSTAVEAAAVIHTDIARGLIRAEVVSYDDLIAAGSLTEARKQGLLRLEGKGYIVQDGDVCHFLSNV